MAERLVLTVAKISLPDRSVSYRSTHHFYFLTFGHSGAQSHKCVCLGQFACPSFCLSVCLCEQHYVWSCEWIEKRWSWNKNKRIRCWEWSVTVLLHVCVLVRLLVMTAISYTCDITRQPSVDSSLKITDRSFRYAAPHLWTSILLLLSLIHIWRCRRSYACRSRWSPYH